MDPSFPISSHSGLVNIVSISNPTYVLTLTSARKINGKIEFFPKSEIDLVIHVVRDVRGYH